MILEQFGGRESVKASIRAMIMALAKGQDAIDNYSSNWLLHRVGCSDRTILAERPPQRTGRILNFERANYRDRWTVRGFAPDNNQIFIYTNIGRTMSILDTGILGKMVYWAMYTYFPEAKIVEPVAPESIAIPDGMSWEGATDIVLDTSNFIEELRIVYDEAD